MSYVNHSKNERQRQASPRARELISRREYTNVSKLSSTIARVARLFLRASKNNARRTEGCDVNFEKSLDCASRRTPAEAREVDSD